MSTITIPGFTTSISSNSISYAYPQSYTSNQVSQTSFPYYNPLQQQYQQYMSMQQINTTYPYTTTQPNVYDGHMYDAYFHCADCSAFHTPLFDYLSMIDTEEEFRLLFRRAIKNHYKMKDIKTTTIPNYNMFYFADLVSLKAFVNGHFKEYTDLLEGYLAII
jgi:hypothetical protein